MRSRGGRYSFVRTGRLRALPRGQRGRQGPGVQGRTRLGEVEGTLDAHGHLTAYEFIGGKFHCGKPFSPLGIQDALPDCSKDRGPNGVNAPLQNLLDTRLARVRPWTRSATRPSRTGPAPTR